MSLVENPYAPPASESFAATPATLLMDPEEIRKQYLRHEAAVRSVGSLYYLGGAIMAVAGVAGLVEASAAGGEALGASLVCLVLSVVWLLVGRSLRRLDPRVKTPVVLLAALGLLAVPIGTLINAYILYLMLSKKAKVVFSEDYKEVIRKTPQIKYRSRFPLFAILGGLLLVVLITALAAL